MKCHHGIVCLSAVLFALFTATPVAAEKPRTSKKEVKPAVELKVRSWKGLQKLVAAHKGKVVVVDIWTTTCGTCVEEFPKFAALQKQFPKDKIALISLNCDYDGIKDKPPEFYRADVTKFLRKQNATFENVMLNIAFIDFLDQVDLSSTPAVLVYRPNGKLAKRFDNDKAEKLEDEFTIKDVKQQIAKLLKK
ncbi:MAG: TlpA family protein disulfide reductase [Planctomycetaceae bacterium]|jgi:thiol-disulfide isomerase/thioredoxin|nr:TlpA family protein disulfide reductase [Planctomycetaceae bacterium]MBT6154248.1 TlpA family protein disulfide reductase [Planctomycetaceae bacterium]MBT6485548.1 TlpA family protein disulfide reductase [Planctomycetaceae bacterium]